MVFLNPQAIIFININVYTNIIFYKYSDKYCWQHICDFSIKQESTQKKLLLNIFAHFLSISLLHDILERILPVQTENLESSTSSLETTGGTSCCFLSCHLPKIESVFFYGINAWIRTDNFKCSHGMGSICKEPCIYQWLL